MKPTKRKALLVFIRIKAKLWLRFHAPQVRFISKTKSTSYEVLFVLRRVDKKDATLKMAKSLVL